MRRGRYRIISDILSEAKKPSTKTSIVYGANLSFQQAERYLDLLVEEGLLTSHESEHKEYKITEEGRDFLVGFKELSGLLAEEEKESRRSW